jgi:hypothetical protein
MNKIAFLALAAIPFLPACSYLKGPQGQAAIAQLQAQTSPENVQRDITVLGALAKPNLPANVVSDISEFKNVLGPLATDTIAPDTFAALIAKYVPANRNSLATGIVTVASTAYNVAYAKYGPHNKSTIAYLKAIADGLTGAGF